MNHSVSFQMFPAVMPVTGARQPAGSRSRHRPGRGSLMPAPGSAARALQPRLCGITPLTAGCRPGQLLRAEAPAPPGPARGGRGPPGPRLHSPPPRCRDGASPAQALRGRGSPWCPPPAGGGPGPHSPQQASPKLPAPRAAPPPC